MVSNLMISYKLTELDIKLNVKKQMTSELCFHINQINFTKYWFTNPKESCMYCCLQLASFIPFTEFHGRKNIHKYTLRWATLGNRSHYLFHACHFQGCHFHEPHSYKGQVKELQAACFPITYLKKYLFCVKEIRGQPSCLNSKISSNSSRFSLKRIGCPYQLTCRCNHSNTLPCLECIERQPKIMLTSVQDSLK